MSGYIIRNTAHDKNRFHICRPGQKDPSFMVPTIKEAFALIDLDKAQAIEPMPLNRCPGCVKEDCPCLPV